MCSDPFQDIFNAKQYNILNRFIFASVAFNRLFTESNHDERRELK